MAAARSASSRPTGASTADPRLAPVSAFVESAETFTIDAPDDVAADLDGRRQLLVFGRERFVRQNETADLLDNRQFGIDLVDGGGQRTEIIRIAPQGRFVVPAVGGRPFHGPVRIGDQQTDEVRPAI